MFSVSCLCYLPSSFLHLVSAACQAVSQEIKSASEILSEQTITSSDNVYLVYIRCIYKQ